MQGKVEINDANAMVETLRRDLEIEREAREHREEALEIERERANNLQSVLEDFQAGMCVHDLLSLLCRNTT